MPKRERLWIAYLIFWSILFLSLAISVYLGLTSSWPWYLERTSYKMYEAMLLSAVILLAFLVIAVQIRTRRLQNKEKSLRARIAMLEKIGAGDIDVSRILEEIEEAEKRRKHSWLSVSPLILMILVLLSISVFALAELPTFLAENYKINTMFVLFAGGCSKMVIGLESIVLYKLTIPQKESCLTATETV